MGNNHYRLQYLPLFHKDLMEASRYLSETLNNQAAAKHLVEITELAILKRSYHPLAFESYPSKVERKLVYYRIYVGHFIVYYVVIDDVMEIRRFLYGARNIAKLI